MIRVLFALFALAMIAIAGESDFDEELREERAACVGVSSDSRLDCSRWS